MEECECAICKNNISSNNLCKTNCNHMYCLSCLLLHLKNDNRCPLCRATIEDSESSESEEEDNDTDTPIEITHSYRYELNGVVSVNYNLKILIYIFIVSIQYNVIMFSLFMNNIIKLK
uniref:RING-type domain-containing protein n=1 Tax=viral metagenome TaxID=1070528 RepID=A0A6C0JP38_9ZZZZ